MHFWQVDVFDGGGVFMGIEKTHSQDAADGRVTEACTVGRWTVFDGARRSDRNPVRRTSLLDYSRGSPPNLQSEFPSSPHVGPL